MLYVSPAKISVKIDFFFPLRKPNAIPDNLAGSSYKSQPTDGDFSLWPVREKK